jgi:hypothetical protein
VIELAGMRDFVLRLRHARGDLRRRVAARTQARGQRIEIGRGDEHADGLRRQRRLHLPVALPVDVEQHVLAARQRRFHRPARRAIGAAEDARIFQEFVVLNHRVETFLVDEMIMHAVSLTRPRGAGGGADGEGQPVVARQQRARNRGLAGARGGGQHQTNTLIQYFGPARAAARSRL